MQVRKQFSVFMVNKPGTLAQVLSAFAREKINVVAVTMVDSMEHGVMRVVTANHNKAGNILAKLNMAYNQTDVICVTLSNKPGAIAEVVEKLARHHINIAYAYCTAGAKGGKTTGVLKVANVKKTIKILEEKTATGTKSHPTIRRSPASRR